MLRQRALDAGAPAATLASGFSLASATGLDNTGTSFATWPAAKGIAAQVAAGILKAVDTLPAVSALHAKLPGSQSMVWVAAGAGAGATFCVVAKLPAKAAANSNQVLFDFSPVFKMAREGTGGDMAFYTGATRAVVKNAFDNRWHAYVAVANSTRTQVYIDGALKATLVHPAVAGKAATAHIFGASAAAPGAMLAGDVRQLMAWTRALPAAELAALQKQLKSKWKLL